MKNTVVVITGGSSGIGAALAELLAAQRTLVGIVARREEALRAVAERCDGRAHPIVADVTRRDEVRRAVTDALDKFGQIDVWVNNAGQGISRVPSELTDEDIDDMVRVNVKSVLYCTQEILPHFKSRGRGHVINVSSMLGRIPYVPIRAAYGGAKHYVNALTANFRAEIQETYPDIQFSLISPGVVRTEFGVNAKHGGVDSRQLPQSQSPEQAAAVIAGVIASRRPDVYTAPGSRERVMEYFSTSGENP
jgi:NADP-dependent 3-hydroxy acid dehydrogenase YdfG